MNYSCCCERDIVVFIMKKIMKRFVNNNDKNHEKNLFCEKKFCDIIQSIAKFAFKYFHAYHLAVQCISDAILYWTLYLISRKSDFETAVYAWKKICSIYL